MSQGVRWQNPKMAKRTTRENLGNEKEENLEHLQMHQNLI